MRKLAPRILVFIISLGYFSSQAQQLHYSAAESQAIHDSINISRWDIGGRLSHYAFRYMSEFFPVSIISKPVQPFRFGVGSPAAVKAIQVKTKQASYSFEDYLAKKHIVSFIVIQNGNIIYEKYFSMLPEDQHTLQSVNKVVTSLLITNLINENRISVDAPIEKYIPELNNSDWKGISVRNILNMRTGMDIRSVNFETGPFSNPDHKNYQLESALGILPKTRNTPASVYQYLAGLKKDTTAGLEGAYSNLNTFVLGWLAEKVTGKKYADLVTEKIWKPMGASSDAYVCLSDKGIAWPHGGMSATLRDLARFGMLFTNKEIAARKESLISFAQLKEIFDAPEIPNPIAPAKWVYQWDTAKDGILMKGGFGGQALYVLPEKNIVIAYYNYVDADWSVNPMISDAALQQIIKAIL